MPFERTNNIERYVILCWIALMVMLSAGCSAKYYREDADQQVYEILRKAHQKLYDSVQQYDIEQLALDPLKDLPRSQAFLIEMPDAMKRFSSTPLMISLEKAFEIAAYHNREYQTQKEDVYLTALTLTEEQNEFSSQFGGLISGLWSKTGDEESISAKGGLNVSRLLKTGASIGINLSTEFLRYLTGDPRRTVASILAVSIIQPLWRGAGEKIAAENLKQTERNVIYSVRSLARYRKTFIVKIASSHFRVLQQRAVVRNERQNYLNLVLASYRAQMMAKAGRLPEFQADQAKQDELRAMDRWTRAVKTYYELLDSYKIDLGLPIDANLDLDNADLEKLVHSGIRHPDIELEKAVSMALDFRQDLKNVKEKVEDAERKIEVAKNSFGTDISLNFEANVPSKPDTQAAELRFDDATWSGGFDVDLPFERLSERNVYRRALITYKRMQRDLSLKTDEIKLEITSDWRTLQQAMESYNIQINSVKLAQQRVESTSLLLQAGRVDTRDLLESQAALVEAQNALVRALMDHTIARLEFYRDNGTLKHDQSILDSIFSTSAVSH